MRKKAHRTTEHTHCGSEPDLEVVRFLAPRESWFSKQVLCLRKIGSHSVTALALAKALLLGDMPKRHVGYALTLGDMHKALAT